VTAETLTIAPAEERPEEQVDVRFRLPWQEYYAAERFLLRQRQRFAPEQFVGVALLTVSAALYAVAGLGWFQPLMSAAGLVLVSTPFFRRQGLRRRWAREPLHREEHVISFTKSRIRYLLGGVESDLNWSYFQSWLESPDGFLLVTGEDVFNLIPKRAFAGEAAVSRFRAMAASKLRPVNQP
jgi:hypothetical protein